MNGQTTQPTAILITGASSGIGAALARAYAAPGVVLALSGRDAARLQDVAEACREAGAQVLAETVNVTDADAMAAWIGTVDGAAPLDLVIANAGVAAGMETGGGDAGEARRIFRVNVDGVLNTVGPAVAVMGSRGRGQIAIMSSLAGLRGMPSAPAYAASKAAVRSLAEGLRGRLAGDGIRVSAICPGFVESRMTAGNPFPMPMLMTAEKAAGIIVRGLRRNKARIAFPWPLALIMGLLAALPPGWTDPLFRHLPKKE
jgi:NADP-dependent 3-hydroxy acid dehydrogenase YdfG